MNDPRGSIWRKWDLHVHTPDSIVHEYKGADDPWERFLQDLESLPPDFQVVGVNDYIFLDGYRRIIDEKRKGRLKNILLFLPVIELRLDKFAGTEGHLSKVNFHVIFSDEISPDVIEAQFISALSSKYQLAPQYASRSIRWQGVPTKSALEDLGNKIIASSPDDKKSDHAPPLIVGFNALTLQLQEIQAAVESSFFEDRVVTAVGLTEWAAVRWTKAVADKRNVVNSAQLLFVSSASIEEYKKARESLTRQGVNDRLLDCSDAHYFSDSPEKDRIGNCLTWIKADPTFEGLTVAVKEFEERVYVGDEPPKIRAVRENQTKYMKSIALHRVSKPDSGELWFDQTVVLSSGLVAVIGRKGSGKSAFTDALGLLGNSAHEDDFSFLNPNRFRDPKDNKAKSYQAILTWESGPAAPKSLDDRVDPAQVEKIKYIPQNFLETICNEIQFQKETQFDRELKGVIFSHVDAADRLGQASLDALIAYKTDETYRAISILKAELSAINEDIVELEGQSTEEYRRSVESQLRSKDDELKSHEAGRPVEVPPPDVDAARQAEVSAITAQVEAAREEEKKLEAEIQSAAADQKAHALVTSAIDKALSKIDNFQRQFRTFLADLSRDLESVGVDFRSVVNFTVNKEPIEKKRQAAVAGRLRADATLNPQNVAGPVYKIGEVRSRIETLQARLNEPAKRYEAYKTNLERWTKRRLEIIGEATVPDTLEYFKAQLASLAKLPDELKTLEGRRIEKAREIYAQIAKLAEEYRKLYKPVQEFITSHPLAKQKLQLTFEVSIVEAGFDNEFFSYIHQGLVGSFYGADEGRHILRRIMEKYDFNDPEKMAAFLKELLEHLKEDKRSGAGKAVRIGDQLRKGRTVAGLYDWVFSLDYLRPRYTLKLSGRELHQLSPGEKGTLLLIFYLLVDRGDIPLVIDQPEENLDNETIFGLLVPCIKEAKQRRQIVIVTHNPNLAVVCDAEQIIHACEDKTARTRITYTSGGIENPEINKKLLDVLEGTRPAFENREAKYFPEVAGV